MNKSQKIAARIAALKAELGEVRAAEIAAAREAARREIHRAIQASGLLAVVAAGGLSPEALANEFRAAAERLKTPAPTVEKAPSAGEEAPPPAVEKRGWFGGRE